jgi:hypothetical protein
MKQCSNWKTGDFYIKEMKRRFEAMSEQEKEGKREAWRRRFHQKFAMQDNWAEMDLTFWDDSFAMMNSANVVFEKKMATANTTQKVKIPTKFRDRIYFFSNIDEIRGTKSS